MTQNEAAQKLVNSFNAVPTEMIRKLWQADPDDWNEVTCPFVGNQKCPLMILARAKL